MIRGFLEGFAGGSLFTEDERPGAPNQVFADEDSDDFPQRQLVEALAQVQPD
jgi:hypothetical protein